MSTPPKRLERSRSDKVVGGVCGGVADYLNMDPTLVRVLTAILTIITGGVPILVYLVMLFVMPEGRRTPAPFPSVPGPAAGFGSYDPSGRDQAIWGTEGAPWEQRPTAPPAPSAPFRAAAQPPPVWSASASTQPVPSEPEPSDPPPVEPYDPTPVGPSDPEAPVAPPSEPGQPTVPTDEGRSRSV